MSKTVAVIGGGVAGLETSIQLEKLGYTVNLFEKESQLGGHAGKWDRLFPNRRHANEVIESLTSRIKDKVQVSLSTQVTNIVRENGSFNVESNGKGLKADAVVLTTGFELFPANKKEEYGYGIFDNVITSAELEAMFAANGEKAEKDKWGMLQLK